MSTAAVVVLAAVVTGGELFNGLTGFAHSTGTQWTAYNTLNVVTSQAWWRRSSSAASG